MVKWTDPASRSSRNFTRKLSNMRNLRHYYNTQTHALPTYTVHMTPKLHTNTREPLTDHFIPSSQDLSPAKKILKKLGVLFFRVWMAASPPPRRCLCRSHRKLVFWQKYVFFTFFIYFSDGFSCVKWGDSEWTVWRGGLAKKRNRVAKK